MAIVKREKHDPHHFSKLHSKTNSKQICSFSHKHVWIDDHIHILIFGETRVLVMT